MSDHAAPPLPAAPALTLAAADQWRAARSRRRLESRWLALLPLATFVLAAAADDLPDTCDRLNACAVPYGEGIAEALVLVEALLLLLHPRRSYAVPAVAGLLFWFLPDALPGTWVRLTVLLAHLAVAAALYRVETGRRRARAQLTALMGPPTPYPWTLLDQDPPTPPPARPTGRRAAAALLAALAATLLALGAWAAHDSAGRSLAADEVRATVRNVRDDGATATVAYQLPSGGRTFTADLDIWWDWRPQVGDHVALLADDTGWYRVAGETYDPAPWWIGAGLAGTLAALLLLSAHRTDTARRAPADAAPALRVRLRQDAGGLGVLPLDGGDTEPPLWRLARREDEAHYEPADEDGPAEWLPYGLPEDLDDLDPPAARTPAEAAALLERAARPVEALLYHGPDGPHRQLLVYRRPEDPDLWLAESAAAHPAPVRLRRPAPGADREALEISAAAARLLEQHPVEPAAPPEPARVYGMPAALRWGVGPVVAVLLAAVMARISDGGVLDGLVRPLALGLPFLFGAIGACGWQLAVDRDGVAFSGTVRLHRIPWDRVTAAAVHRGRFTAQAVGTTLFGFGAWPARALHGHFGGAYDPQQTARTVTVLAAHPERRPVALLPADAVGRTLPLNRLAIAAYAAWVVVAYLAG